MADLSRLGRRQLLPGMMSLSVALGDPGDLTEYGDPAVYRDFADYGDLAAYQEFPSEQGEMQRPPDAQLAGMTVRRPGIFPIPPGAFDEWQKNADKGMAGLWNYFRRGVSGGGGNRNDPDCEKEWAEARRICADELSRPFPRRTRTGGHLSIEDCARGWVTEECGGNPLDRERRGRK